MTAFAPRLDVIVPVSPAPPRQQRVSPGEKDLPRGRVPMRAAAALLVLFFCAKAAHGSGTSVLLVVNTKSSTSLKIGEYYARKRGIPGKNVCRLAVSPQEEISRQAYEREIAEPIANFLKERGLAEQVLYVVTTKGVPLKIEGSSGMQGDAASVDSELSLMYSRLRGEEIPAAGPLRNPFYEKLLQPFEHPKFPIYLVTRLTGYDFDDIRGMIDRSVQAKNQGVFVLDLQSPNGGEGDNWLQRAARLLPKQRVLVDASSTVIYDAEQVIGYASWGSNDLRRIRHGRRRLGFRWLPGAIATEFVSTNGRTFAKPPDSWTFTGWEDKENFFAGSPQGLTADYIHDGATGASGHVYEPFLEFTPRPDYLFVAYYAGRNLAESYYLSIPALSWMNIVVGDPLCSIGPPKPGERKQ